MRVQMHASAIRQDRRVPLLGEHGIEWAEVDLAVVPQGRPVALAKSELVLIAAVDLPLASRQQRAAAAPFAIEDMLAEPLSQTHVALGAEIAPRRHLVCAVSDALMARWTEDLARAGLGSAEIAPDVAIVPRPPEDAWALIVAGARTLVRRADGTGFAAPTESFAVLWEAAGRPPVILHAGAAPPGVDCAPAVDPPVAIGPAETGLDLRRGAYAIGERRGTVLLRRWGLTAAIGAAALGALFAADTLALLRQAETRRDEAAALLRAHAPEARADGDLVASLARLTRSEDTRPQGRFLPLFARAAAALEPASEGLAFRALRYDADTAELSIEVEAPDLSALQRIEAALAVAGLDPRAGAATVDDGAAAARIVLRDPEAGS